MAVTIKSVQKHSPAAKAGINAAEILVSINGHEINDVLDYEFYAAETRLVIGLSDREVVVKKGEYDDLGLEFETYLMDQKQSCKNNCIFCFISQLPKGMRESLYFKDDDARLSFLQGNYITLTNLKESDVDRIIKMRLKVNISVHTTNPELRVFMMKNPNAGKCLDYLWRMAEAGLEMNCQLVLCRGINDGAELERSLADLTRYPSITSIACVPVGLTKYRDGLMKLEPFDKESSAAVIDTIEKYGDKILKERGERGVFPSDEFFLKAEREIPPYEYYEDFEQYENGVGMWASLLKEFSDAVADKADNGELDGEVRNKTLVTGALAAPLMKKLADKTQEMWYNTKVNVIAIRNEFFGEAITVAGLTTGGDIIKQLTPVKEKLGTEIIIPLTMLRANSDTFLDDVTVGDVEKALGVKVTAAAVDGYELLDAILSAE